MMIVVEHGFQKIVKIMVIFIVMRVILMLPMIVLIVVDPHQHHLDGVFIILQYMDQKIVMVHFIFVLKVMNQNQIIQIIQKQNGLNILVFLMIMHIIHFIQI